MTSATDSAVALLMQDESQMIFVRSPEIKERYSHDIFKIYNLLIYTYSNRTELGSLSILEGRWYRGAVKGKI